MQRRVFTDPRQPVRLKSTIQKHRKRLHLLMAAIGAAVTVTAFARS